MKCLLLLLALAAGAWGQRAHVTNCANIASAASVNCSLAVVTGELVILSGGTDGGSVSAATMSDGTTTCDASSSCSGGGTFSAYGPVGGLGQGPITWVGIANSTGTLTYTFTATGAAHTTILVDTFTGYTATVENAQGDIAFTQVLSCNSLTTGHDNDLIYASGKNNSWGSFLGSPAWSADTGLTIGASTSDVTTVSPISAAEYRVNTPIGTSYSPLHLTCINGSNCTAGYCMFVIVQPIAAFVVSPTRIDKSTSNITLSFVGTGTSWGPTTRFTLSGAGATGTSCSTGCTNAPTVANSTHASIVVSTGSTTGTMTITESVTGSGTGTVVVQDPGPAISNLAATANSPNSINLVWTTDVKASSQASCGTASNGPYTYVSPTVDPVKSGNDYYGVIEHSLAVVVPTNTSPTAYFCVVTAVGSNDNISHSTEVSSGTTAALTNTPFSIVTGPQGWIRFNDQQTGANGILNTGKGYQDDSFFCAWAGDGNNYCSLNDAAGTTTDHGVTFCCAPIGPVATGVVQTSADGMTINMRGNTTGENSTGHCCSGPDLNKPTTYTADGLRSYAEGMQCARGACIIALPRAGSPQCTPFVLSRDGFMTTIAPQDNTGPSVTGSTFTGASQGTWGYPRNQGECSLQTYVTVRQHGFAQDWGGTPPIVGHPGYQFPVTHQAGTDAWIYSLTYTNGVENFGIMRTPVNNIQVTENGQVIAQMYNGTGHGNDGLLDSNWVNVGAGLGTQFNQYPLGRRPSVNWIGGSIRRWVMIGFAPTPDTGGAGGAVDGSGGLIISDIGPYPWALADAVQVGYLPGDPLLEPTFGPVMASILESTCKYPADGSVICMLICTGNYLNTGTNQYGPHYRWVHFVPKAQAINPNHISWNGSKNTHISNSLDLLYLMDMPVWSTTITDYSPPRASKPNGYTVTGIAAQLVVNDGRGLMGGWPQAGSMATPTTITITTPYTAALTNFTLIATFSHNANQPVVANETVLDKTDIQIKRNGSSANSWVMKVGGVTSSAFSLATDGSFATLIVRRIGATVTLYSSAGIATNGRFTALTTISLSGDIGTGATGANTLILGSLAAATQPFYGTLAELAIWSRALTDAELISEVATLRFDVSTRNPIVSLP